MDRGGNQQDGGRDFRNRLALKEKVSYPANEGYQLSDFQRGRVNSNSNNGPENNEFSGLQILERKRMRGGPGNYEVMDTEGGLKVMSGSQQVRHNTEVVLSEIDCATSSNIESAKLAVQASRQP